MQRKPFNFDDIEKDCAIEYEHLQLDGKKLGAKIIVPAQLMQQYPYNASAYAFLQQCRSAIHQYGLLEFPQLPLNKCNYTLAQKAPKEHIGNPNSYMTDQCQSPHQDTPPKPTAFWLDEERQYFATWILSKTGCENFYTYQQEQPSLSIDALHEILVPQSLQQGTGLLLNQQPGLLLIDNSQHHQLYHARTCNFAAIAANPAYQHDAAMYAFNEVGLLHYMDSLDIYRGKDHQCADDKAAVVHFLQQE